MGKKSDPPKVDKKAYQALLAQSTAAAQSAAENSAAQLAWAKETYAKDRALAEPIIQAALQRMGSQDEWAAEDRARQEQFQVAEDRLLSDAMSYDSPERKAQAAAGAASDVYGAMEGSRAASQRALEGYGVDPSSTRFGALDIAVRAQAAAAAVAAANKAAAAVDLRAQQLRSEAIGVGARYGATSLAETEMAGRQGAGALGAALGTTASGAQTMGTGLQWGQQAQGAIEGAGNILSQQQQALMDRYNAKTAADAVLPNAVGQLAGTALGAYMTGGTSLFAPAAGAAAGTAGSGTGVGMSALYATGGEIPEHMSPSGGAEVDDVPIMASAGEFVIPEDVVRRKGEDFFWKLIESSRGMNKKGAMPATQRATA